MTNSLSFCLWICLCFALILKSFSGYRLLHSGFCFGFVFRRSLKMSFFFFWLPLFLMRSQLLSLHIDVVQLLSCVQLFAIPWTAACFHGVKDSQLPCPSPSPWVCSDSCPLNQWCHPTISSSVIVPCKGVLFLWTLWRCFSFIHGLQHFDPALPSFSSCLSSLVFFVELPWCINLFSLNL